MIIRFFYNSSKSLFAKILFGAIILSFGLWGVGDIVRSYVASRTAIQVGKYKIPVDKLRYQYSQKKQNLRNKDGTPLTPAEMKNFNIKKVVLDEIIAQAVELETVKQFGIVVPKISLAQVIRSLPEFQTNGSFDERLYVSMLQQSGMSEAGLLQQIRESISRNQLFHPIISGYKMPNFVRELLGLVYETDKTIWIAKININDVKADEKTDYATLTQYYKDNADKYKKPELRDVVLMKIDCTKFVDEIKITDKEVEEYIKEHEDIFKQVETRNFDRFEFNSKELADATLEQLSKMADRKVQTSAQSVQNVKKGNFPKHIADDLFSLTTGKYSNVHSIGGKFYIYKLVKINKPKEKTKEEFINEARNAIRSDKLNSSEFYSTVKDIKNRIEDTFASGADIDTIAKDFKTELIELKNYDKQKDKERIRNTVKNEETINEISGTIASLNEKQASPVIEEKDNESMSYVVWVRHITKETLPPFDTVRSKVKSDYEFEAKNKKIIEVFNELTLEVENPIAQIKTLPDAKNYTICKKDLLLGSKKSDFEKLQKDYPYPGVISDALSVLHQNKIKYYRFDENSYLLLGIESFKTPKYASNDIKFVIKRFLGRSMNYDVYNIAQVEIKNRQKIKLHEKIIDEATNTSDADGE